MTQLDLFADPQPEPDRQPPVGAPCLELEVRP